MGSCSPIYPTTSPFSIKSMNILRPSFFFFPVMIIICDQDCEGLDWTGGCSSSVSQPRTVYRPPPPPRATTGNIFCCPMPRLLLARSGAKLEKLLNLLLCTDRTEPFHLLMRLGATRKKPCTHDQMAQAETLMFQSGLNTTDFSWIKQAASPPPLSVEKGKNSLPEASDHMPMPPPKSPTCPCHMGRHVRLRRAERPLGPDC